ncbi:MAG: HAD-IC family P-type ATPase [Actinomycetales bacterium]|nr:HAD-IC family P-type ATPase [Actinomycetales bacterium]
MSDWQSTAHHELPVHEVVLLLETDPHGGLTNDEVERRREAFGANQLPARRGHGPLLRFLRQFHNPLVYVLLGSAVITALVGQTVDTAVIIGVVLVNAVVGYVQESRADRALEALASATRTWTTVIRDGRTERIDSIDVVPGDLVAMEAGDKVPADLRLIEAHDLAMDESALTGESFPVDKEIVVLPSATVVADRRNMGYAGTLVTAGTGSGIVVATGGDTEVGRIHELVGLAEGVQTPLTRKLTRFSRWLTVIILGLAAVTFAIGMLRGETAAEMVVAAVALAVGAIPEGLPAAVTITLAIGVSRMARRNAIIRRLPAAETLGSTTVICTDKTGTLTQNRMTVQYVHAGSRTFPLGGEDDADAAACLWAGVLCNDALLHPDGTAVGDPTEVALLASAAQCRCVDLGGRERWERVDTMPFDSAIRMMATLHRVPGDDRLRVTVKGAVEDVLALCRSERGPDGSDRALDRDSVMRQVDDFADRALRVLAFAQCDVSAEWRFTSGPLTSLPLCFVGLQAMSDPPRAEALRSVAACHSAGIRVTMITGDHAHTARAVARQIGISSRPGEDPIVVTGAELAAIEGRSLQERIDSADAFARVSPEQKLRIVEVLQREGHVVAMTGDGVNDAPALRQADIGIAMGDIGTEVAKEASDMVLTDDDFATIEAAVEEGRSVFDNLTKFIAWTLPTNLGEGLVVLAAIVGGITLPLLPVQILWINMTTAVALGLMLAFEPREPGIMSRPPRPPSRPILTPVLIRRIIIVGTLMLLGSFLLFEFAQAQGLSDEAARTVTMNAFVAMEIGYLINCRVLDRSVLTVGLFSNRLLLLGVGVMIVLQILMTYLPALNVAFHTSPVGWAWWLVVTLLGTAVMGVVALEKRISRSGLARMDKARGVDRPV